MSDSNTALASEPARPSNITSEIDRLIGMTLPGSNVRVNNDGTTEALSMPANAMSRSGDIAPPPALDDLLEQGEKHGARVAQIDADLAAQVYNRNTGQPEGPRVTGKDREQLIAQRERAVNEQKYIAHLIESTHEARIAWNQAKAAEQAGATPAAPTAEDAAARESAIRELAEMPGPDGKPVGRVIAQREYNAAQLRAKADKLARGR
jgi:hypothetical protein